MTKKILVLPGDGIGPEIVAEAVKVLEALRQRHGLDVELEHGLVGGAAIDATGGPLPAETLERAKAADAVLLGAVGGPKWESLDISIRPEKGLLGLRAGLDLFANLRPAILYPQLAGASSLKAEIVAGLDIMIVRELTAGVYFGQPRGEDVRDGVRYGFDTPIYSQPEIERVARVAFELAKKRSGKVTSGEKANVMESGVFWREIVTTLHQVEYA
ncbi:MAG: 3-isopropylmalate dehydrogenase, partial [Gammaproteobacteria bacterium]|nr:3-isopropylmalate dehydrogenase [Gammaproteobacteria bacterium]